MRTSRTSMGSLKRVLAIGGSDPSGGAGIQADLRTIEALGGVAYTVLASIVAQNSAVVRVYEPVSADIVGAQLEAVLSEGPVGAVKTGVLPTAEVVGIVADTIKRHGLTNVVVDPVIKASGGTPLVREEALAELATKLFPLAFVATPNVMEAEALGGVRIRTQGDMEPAARAVQELGPRWVLVTGGDLGAGSVYSLLLGPKGARLFEHPRIKKEVRGTGCMLASAIAAHLAFGAQMEEAVERAQAFVGDCIRVAVKVGAGRFQVLPPRETRL